MIASDDLFAQFTRVIGIKDIELFGRAYVVNTLTIFN